MKKISLLLPLIAFILYGCSGGAGSKGAGAQQASSQESVSQEASSQETTEEDSFLHEPEDERPPIVLKGTGYELALPANAGDVQCEPVSEVREFDLLWQGYDLIVRPISITRNGNNHVQLGQPATVRFAIPEDVPAEQYDELVGMLFTDKGTEYKIPDYYALREGFVQFETSHFSDAAAGRNKDSLRERFIEQVAVNGWGRNMNNKKLEPTWREQITKFANDHCMGENDLAGIALRELYKDKDIVKIAIDIVNAHDMENASLEKRLNVATENMVKVAESKLLGYLLDKLKEEETKKIKVLDELKSEKKGEVLYKTEIEKIDSKRNKILGVLKDRFSMENVEEVSKFLGSDPTPEQCYIFACEYLAKYAKSQLEDKVKEMIPYISTVQNTAKAVEIWKKFWAATQMQDLYKTYEDKANERGRLLDGQEWYEISMYVTTPKFLHGMTDAQIREKIEQRYLEKKEIEERKAFLRKYLNTIETFVNLNSECLERKHFDYVQRLTVVRNLMDRFYDELVDEDGYLIFYEDGYRKEYGNQNVINEQLCTVVNMYLQFYPDQDRFYEWLDENGYNFGQFEDEYNRLDALLWKEKAQNNPDIHIVIQEALGAESGIPKHMNHTICLATNGKPYKEWYHTIPETDSIRTYGWKREFPAEDEDIKLSQYKAIGMPNQVLIYADEKDFLTGKEPIKTVLFEVDTTNNYTYVELNEDAVVLTDFYYNPHASGAYLSYETSVTGSDGKSVHLSTTGFMLNGAMNDAFEDVHLFIDLWGKNNNFSFKVSGACDESDYGESAEVELTVTGHIDFDKKNEYAKRKEVGIVNVKGTMKGVTRQGTQIKGRFNLSGKIVAEGWKNNVDFRIKCYAEGSFEYEGVDSKGNRIAATTKGTVQFDFLPYFDPEEFE